MRNNTWIKVNVKLSNCAEKWLPPAIPELRVEDALDAEAVPRDFHDGGVRCLELRRQVHLGA